MQAVSVKAASVLLAWTLLFVMASNIALAGSNAQITARQITAQQVRQAQQQWATGIVKIGEAYAQHGDFKRVASALINQLYAYNQGQKIVLFKPTKTRQQQFRNTYEAALSYFVGYKIVKNMRYREDKGFALAPWTKVVFRNDQIFIHNDVALAMGVYDFTDTNGKTTQVEYSFGYVKAPNGQLKIVLHHSSLPFAM